MENIEKSKHVAPADSCERPQPERRGGEKDRRCDRKARFKYFLVNGRRESARRTEDKTSYFFFDRYSQGMFTAITAILMLSIVDGLLTLLLIERGASELNPVMAYFLEYGPLSFITAKYVLTSFGVFLLLIFKNVFINPISIYTQSLFAPVIFTFGTVIVWELWLLFATR